VCPQANAYAPVADRNPGVVARGDAMFNLLMVERHGLTPLPLPLQPRIPSEENNSVRYLLKSRRVARHFVGALLIRFEKAACISMSTALQPIHQLQEVRCGDPTCAALKQLAKCSNPDSRSQD